MNNETLKIAEDLAAKKVETSDIMKEVGKLKKMINVGFEGNLDGFDKIAKILVPNTDTKKLENSYDMIANCIKALKITGNFDKFCSYLRTIHNITIQADPTIKYITKPKKKQKFNDLYSEYFLEDPTRDPNETIKKIMNSLSANFGEIQKQNDQYKEEFEAVKETIDCPPRTFKTMINLEVAAQKKEDKGIAEILEEANIKLQNDQSAVDALEKKIEK